MVSLSPYLVNSLFFEQLVKNQLLNLGGQQGSPVSTSQFGYLQLHSGSQETRSGPCIPGCKPNAAIPGWSSPLPASPCLLPLEGTEQELQDPAAPLTKPGKAPARVRQRNQGWVFIWGTATGVFTFLPAWCWKAEGEVQSGSLPSPRCTWYSGPALQGDKAGGCTQGESTPPSPRTPGQLAPRRLPLGAGRLSGVPVRGSEGRRRRGVCVRGVYPPASSGEKPGSRWDAAPASGAPRCRPRSLRAPRPRRSLPQRRPPVTSPVHRPDPDGNFHLGVRHLPPLPGAAGGPAQRQRQLAASQRRAQRHGGAPTSMPGRGEGGGPGQAGKARGGEGGREGGRGGGSGTGEGGGGAAPVASPLSRGPHRLWRWLPTASFA